MKTLIQSIIIIICFFLISCQEENTALTPKEDLTVSNDFYLMEMLTGDFGVPISNNTLFRGNEVKAVSNYSFVHSNWYLNKNIVAENHVDSLEYLLVNKHTIGHHGSAPNGYSNYNIILDTSLKEKELSLIDYRESGINSDFNSPFTMNFKYKGEYNYKDSLNHIQKLRIMDTIYDGSHVMYVSLASDCLPNFYITRYAVNGFYSDLHTDFSCNGFYNATIYATHSHNKLTIRIQLDGEDENGIIKKQIKLDAER